MRATKDQTRGNWVKFPTEENVENRAVVGKHRNGGMIYKATVSSVLINLHFNSPNVWTSRKEIEIVLVSKIPLSLETEQIAPEIVVTTKPRISNLLGGKIS